MWFFIISADIFIQARIQDEQANWIIVLSHICCLNCYFNNTFEIIFLHVLRTDIHSHCEIQVYTDWTKGNIEGRICTEDQMYSKSGGHRAVHAHPHQKHIHILKMGATWPWAISHECTHRYLHTTVPSQLYKMTERPGALQTALKDIHTAMTVSGWKKENTEKYCLGEQNRRVNPSNVWN